MKASIFVSTLLLLSTPVFAQDASADPAPAAKLDKNDPNAIRCRKVSQIGSLVKKERICKTNAEWARSRDAMQRDADDLITRTRSGMNPNG